MLTLLSAPPAVLTSEDLAAISTATPDTFIGIAPLLRHKEDNVDFFIEPPFQSFAGGKGTLSITEGAVSFFSPSTSSGISIPYPHITMHAISRAPLRPLSAVNGADDELSQVGGGPCIYCQVDESEETADSDDMDSSRELIIIPTDPSNLDKIFETLSTCAALHPPPASSSGDGGLFGGLDPESAVYADADVVEQLTEEEEADQLSAAGRAAREYLESIIVYSTPAAAAPTINGHGVSDAEEGNNTPSRPNGTSPANHQL